MKFWLGILSFLGFAIAAISVWFGSRQSREEKPPPPIAAAPFEHSVMGTGILEASTQNISVGTPVSGIVSKVQVKWGDRVKPGDSLFTIDDRDLSAALVSAEAKVAEAAPLLDRARYQLKLSEKLGSYVSEEEVVTKRYEVAADEAALNSAKAHVQEVRMEMERRLIRAPAAGRILTLNVRPGEFAAGDAAAPLIVLGNDDSLLVRVEVDEHEAWRVQPGAKAVAFLRGNPAIRIPVFFQRIEPRIVPKSLLTGVGTERADTRVLQVIFGFGRDGWPVYVGQLMDVSIEAAPGAGSK